MLMMLAVCSENRRRGYADDFCFLRHLPSESITIMLMMLVLFVRDHLCKAIVRLAASYPLNVLTMLLFWTACLRTSQAANMAQ